MSETVGVYVGCSANGEDAESMLVLEYTMKKHSSLPVNIHWMRAGREDSKIQLRPEWTGWRMETWATPFSGFRWSVPHAAGFQGKAIYMDSDMIILSDIAELWNQKFLPGKVVLTKGPSEGQGWRYCVCLWDCAAAKPYLPPLEKMKKEPTAHQQMMQFFARDEYKIAQPFQGNWNCIDGENLPIEEIDILHYSDMSTQMHLKYAIPRLTRAGRKHWFDGQIHEHWRKDLIELFDSVYVEALTEGGYELKDYIPEDPFGEYQKESQANYDQYRHKWSR